ncbi:MAG TPA: carboxypeptidase regulatory-like domain-containing protein [Acidobacteriaceae bacterium]|nr:carboxypeptidase regulatory-like domain-containing protein [Acidobacteriaceae bacterium]
MKKIVSFLLPGALCLLVCSFFVPPIARAQQTLGSLNGTVTDVSGAAVGGASVAVVSDQTGLQRATTTQSTGYWEILNLPIGTYKVTISAPNFETQNYPGIAVQEMRATTIPASLKPGKVTESVTVTANPLLNATDTTNGYTLDSAQIDTVPLATGSFTQLAVLAPGVNAELLSGLDSNAGLGNQNIWANGQRATSNTFQVNGVDSSNIFNGMTSSGLTSQRYNFNIGGGSESGTSSAGAANIGGAAQTGTSVYGSNGNSLPSPPPEFLQEMRVNTSMYDAQQGATSGAQIDASTANGTNDYHGQIYTNFDNNFANAAPFFFKQEYLLAQQGVGAFPSSLANPSLHRWSVGGTMGGPVIKNKLFFFAGFQHLYLSDQSTAVSQLTVPSDLTNDRSAAGITAAATQWQGSAFTKTIDPIAMALLQAKVPTGGYLIPSAQVAAGTPYQYGIPNVTLIGTSTQTGEQGTGSLQYNLSNTDQLSLRYYYQLDPVEKLYGMSATGGFPQSQKNGSQVGAISNTQFIGSKMTVTETLGFNRMYSYSDYTQTVPGGTFGIGPGSSGLYMNGTLPGILIKEMGANSSSAPGLKMGPYSSFADIGYYQNRINPSANAVYAMGKHTITVGGGYNYTQLNVENNRDGIAQLTASSFSKFLTGSIKESGVLESIANGHNNADRYYRTNESSAYAQDKWQALPNLSITAGIRYDYHGGLTEKYGNIFNFDPSVYNVTGTTTTGFVVNNAGFVVAGNNKYNPTKGVSDSTLTGRQWGFSPRVGFAWSPKDFHNKLVWRGGFGVYFDRGELFSYLSQPAGSSYGGPFGVTESAPLASFATGGGTLENPFSSLSSYVAPSSDPSLITQALQTTLNGMTGSETVYGETFTKCGGVGSQLDYTACPYTLNFGAYDSKNVLPYTMNFTLNAQWQPTTNVAVTLGYTGNRGRHAVVPIPFNEPKLATSTNPIWGEAATYGFEVLNQNTSDQNYDYLPIAGEPWNTEDGGNTDFRAPYVGYSPNAAFFETVGNSAYDALESHVEKRFSHNFEGGVSYTFSHTYDDQSDIGLFFTGDNPNNLRSSYARADFDRTNVFSGNFDVMAPNLSSPNTLASWFTNDWHLSGMAIAQSGQPYSLYEFYGAVGSVFFGDYPTLMNPVLPIKNPSNPKSALTGNSGKYRTAGSYIPAIDPSQIDIHYLAPGTDGIPVSTGSDPQDIFETDFAPGQRNLFRQAFQKQLNLQIHKDFHPSERFTVRYDFNMFNVTNTTSLDVPQNQTEIRQTSSCSNSAYSAYGGDNNCGLDYVNYGQVVSSPAAADQQSALSNLDQIPVHNGSGKSTTIPTQINGSPNNGANFGSVTSTIGSSRIFTMALHVTF